MSSKELYEFYRQFDEHIPKATVNWRVYELVKKGVIERVGKGKFEWGTATRFHPSLNNLIKNLNKQITEQFPYINYCLWDTSFLKTFQHHMMGFDFILLDVEKDSMESVFLFLKEKHRLVFLKPEKEMIERYVIGEKNAILIRQLISEAPVQKEKYVPTVTIEKLLVDLYFDDEFEYLHGNELLVIFRNIFGKFTVNRSKLLRYAARKGKQNKLLDFLEKNDLITPRYND